MSFFEIWTKTIWNTERTPFLIKRYHIQNPSRFMRYWSHEKKGVLPKLGHMEYFLGIKIAPG